MTPTCPQPDVVFEASQCTLSDLVLEICEEVAVAAVACHPMPRGCGVDGLMGHESGNTVLPCKGDEPQNLARKQGYEPFSSFLPVLQIRLLPLQAAIPSKGTPTV